MPASRQSRIQYWIAEPLQRDVRQSIERLAEANDVEQIAVMPDVHLSGEVCVGVALATNRLIYPAAVGNDIGCGMAAIRFSAQANALASMSTAAQLLGALQQQVPALKHGDAASVPQLPDELLVAPLSAPPLQKLTSREGRWQFGTLGRGNHFVEFQADEQDRLWLMVHSGSRAMGQAIARFHVARASRGVHRRGLVALVADEAEGRQYLNDVEWAIRYAEHNRLAIVRAAASAVQLVLGADCDWDSLIHANHNHVRAEVHRGRPLWVHRKGALWAAEGEMGVIPGSMGTTSYHVIGRGKAESLCSSSHGAGRALARGDAMRNISSRQVASELQGVWYDERATSRLRDEAPSAYKNIHRVMRAQRELTRIVRELRPLLSYKGF